MDTTVDFERKICGLLDVKQDEADANTITGYANVFDIVDNGGDMVHRGAFTKTIQERVPKGMVKLCDTHQWNSEGTKGTVVEAREDNKGLWFKARFATTDDAQDVRTKILEGHIGHCSIGYDPVQWDFENLDAEKAEKQGTRTIRHLREVKLYEISVCPFAMNEESVILSAKAVMPYQDLPLAGDTTEWDAKSAAERVIEWAAAQNGLHALPSLNETRYRKAFLRTDNSLQIADIIDGKLHAIPRAIIAAGGVLMGADIPEAELSRMKAHLAKYYAKMDKTPPWETEETAAMVAEMFDVFTTVKRGKAIDNDTFTRARGYVSQFSDVLAGAKVDKPGEAASTSTGILAGKSGKALPPEVIRALAQRSEIATRNLTTYAKATNNGRTSKTPSEVQRRMRKAEDSA